MSWAGQERRAHPRAAYSVSVDVFAGQEPLGAYVICDISVGGARMVGERPLEVGREIEIRVAGGKLAATQLSATVMRAVPRGTGADVGIQFRRPPSAIAAMIEEVVLEELARSTSAAE
jgi:hypothetical protein